MRLSCNFVNVYKIAYCVQSACTRVHARIPNGHTREENRACRTSRRGSSCVFGSWRTKLFLWQDERGSRPTRRHPRDDPRAEVGEDVRVGVRVGAVECQLNTYALVNSMSMYCMVVSGSRGYKPAHGDHVRHCHLQHSDVLYSTL